MSDFTADDDSDADRDVEGIPTDDIPQDGIDDERLVEEIAEDVRTDILMGHVEDDVSHVLEERFEEVGLTVPPDEIEDLAEDIENDVSS